MKTEGLMNREWPSGAGGRRSGEPKPGVELRQEGSVKWLSGKLIKSAKLSLKRKRKS